MYKLWVFKDIHKELPKQDFSFFNLMRSIIYSGIFKYFCLNVSKTALCTLPILHFLLFSKHINPIWSETVSGLGRHLPCFVFARTVFKVCYERGNDTVSLIFFLAMNFASADKRWYALCKRMQTIMSWKHLINRLFQADTLFWKRHLPSQYRTSPSRHAEVAYNWR